MNQPSLVSSRTLPTAVSVWVVEDNDLLRETITDVLEQAEGLACTLAVSSGEDALAALAAGHVPEVVLMDLGLPGISGQEGIQRIRAISPASQIIVLTVHEDEDRVFEAICAGACGYLLKPSSGGDIVGAIETARRGGSPMSPSVARKVLDMFSRFARPKADYGLTEREREILQILVEGRTMKEIAVQLFLSPHTVDTHLRNIYAKLHVHSRSAAVARALRDRLI